MGGTKETQSIEVIIEETENGVTVKSINNSGKSTQNNHKTVTLDLHNIFVNGTRAAIDLSAIVSLNLSRSNLNYFPDGFAGLELKRLDLSYNNLQNVPDCILNGLRCLEMLDLSHNALDSFDNEPKCVKNLQVLKINNNRLLNIPEWILRVNAFNLEELYYSHNEIISLKASKFLKKASYELKKLELRNCSLRSEDLKYLKHIPTLNVLDLSNESKRNRNCFASCEFFWTLFDKPLWDDRLKILQLSDLQIAFLPEEIAQLVILEELYLSKNDLMWLPDSITSMAKLRILDLSHNKIACLPNDFKNMKNLQILKASHNSISKLFDSACMQLTTLDLYDNYLDTDCDIKIDCNISQIDLEQNFLDSADLGYEGYVEKKNGLRADLAESRSDGPKEQEYDVSSGTDSDGSDWEPFHHGSDDEASRVEAVEENWSSDCNYEPCNGCTASDNEWTGCDTVTTVKRKKKYRLKRYPSWMFEDAREDAS